MKKVIVKFDFPKMTQQHYDHIIKEMVAQGKLIQKMRPHHFAAPSKNGWLVVDVWESEEAFKEFGKILMPIMQKYEIPMVEPEICPLYNEVH